MLSIFGFPWLMYYAIKNHTDNLVNFSYQFDFSGPLGVIRDYLNDSNHFLTYLKNIGSGIGTLFLSLPPLIIYFFLIAIIITILGLMIRIFIDII